MERLEEDVGYYHIIRDENGRVSIQRDDSTESIELIPQEGDGEKLVWCKTLFYGESSAGGAIVSRKALQVALEMLPK